MGLIDDKSFFGVWKRDVVKTERDFSAFYMEFRSEFDYTSSGFSAEGRGIDRIGEFEFDWKYLDNQFKIEFQKKYKKGGLQPCSRGIYAPEINGYQGEWDLGREDDVKEGSFILLPRRVIEKIESKCPQTEGIEKMIARQLLESEFQLLASNTQMIKNQFPFSPPF